MLTTIHPTDHLIETIYSCALELTDWNEVCTEISQMVPGIGVALHLHQIRDHRNVGVVQHGFDPDAVPAYISHYIESNPWLPGLQRQPVGQIVHSDDHVPTEDLLRSEFWNDWLKPQGDFAAGSALVLCRALDRNCALVTNYSHRSATMREETDNLLARIGPHLRQGFDLWRRSSLEREQIGIYEGCLGSIAMPLVIVDADRRMRLANAAAEAILRRNDGLLLGANHEVRAADRRLDTRLGRAIAAVANGSHVHMAPILIAKHGERSEQGHYVVSVFPSPRRGEGPAVGNFRFSDGALAVVAIHDTASELRLDSSVLSETFDLTPTEADLACFMLSGGTLADYARKRCISRYTVRNQLCAIMRKTATHRQADLVGLLTRIALTG